MAYNCIHQLINPRHGERVLWTGFIQVCEIYVYSSFSTFLLYYHCIGQPFRVEPLFISLNLLKLSHFIPNSIRVIFG